MAVVLDENAIGEAVATLVEQIRATAQRSRVAIVSIDFTRSGEELSN